MADIDDDKSAGQQETAPPDETPLQRTLRLKKAAIEAREKPPRGGRFQREQAAKITTGKSRPWMSR